MIRDLVETMLEASPVNGRVVLHSKQILIVVVGSSPFNPRIYLTVRRGPEKIVFEAIDEEGRIQEGRRMVAEMEPYGEDGIQVLEALKSIGDAVLASWRAS